MVKRNLILVLKTALLTFIVAAVVFFPVFAAKAQDVQLEKTKLRTEMDKVKVEIIDIMGELVKLMAEALDKITFNFKFRMVFFQIESLY